MSRVFKVGTTRVEGKLVSYFITDANDDTDLNTRPKAIEFPISILYDEDIQERRAQDYRDYLNKLAEAAESAYNNNQLINILKA